MTVNKARVTSALEGGAANIANGAPEITGAGLIDAAAAIAVLDSLTSTIYLPSTWTD